MSWAKNCEKDPPPSIHRLINDKESLNKILAIYNERHENKKERIILILKESFGNDYPIREFLDNGENIKEDQIACLDCILGLESSKPIFLEKDDDEALILGKPMSKEDFDGDHMIKSPLRGPIGIGCFKEKVNGVVKHGLIKMLQ